MSVIVDDLDIISSFVHPHETYSPLIVDANRPLTCSIALQLLQPVAWETREIAESRRSIERSQFAPSDLDEIRRETPGTSAIEENRTVSILEIPDRHRRRPRIIA